MFVLLTVFTFQTVLGGEEQERRRRKRRRRRSSPQRLGCEKIVRPNIKCFKDGRADGRTDGWPNLVAKTYSNGKHTDPKETLQSA